MKKIKLEKGPSDLIIALSFSHLLAWFVAEFITLKYVKSVDLFGFAASSRHVFGGLPECIKFGFGKQSVRTKPGRRLLKKAWAKVRRFRAVIRAKEQEGKVLWMNQSSGRGYKHLPHADAMSAFLKKHGITTTGNLLYGNLAAPEGSYARYGQWDGNYPDFAERMCCKTETRTPDVYTLKRLD